MIRILQGDVRAMLKTLPDESVHCCITSPPYWGLRDYGTASWDGGDPDCDHLDRPRGGRNPETSAKQISNGGTSGYQFVGECGKCGAQRIDNQLGLELTMAEHIDTMVDVFREVRRVLRKDGTCWLNYGDCYATAPNGRSAADTKASGKDDRTFRDKPFSTVGPILTQSERDRKRNKDGKERYRDDGGYRAVAGGYLKPKDLCMIPNRLAIALQDDGWWVRSEIIWNKPNPMPESVTDRPATAHEKVWLLSKSARYFYDAEAVRTKSIYGYSPSPGMYDRLIGQNQHRDNRVRAGRIGGKDGAVEKGDGTTGANLRNVWTIPTKGYSEAHFATYPPALVETCIKAGTSEKGCCAECGAPWVRNVERTAMVIDRSERTHEKGQTRSSGTMLKPPTSKTLGFSPSCQCNAATIPCTVLDPFIGSGTTAMVADRLQRDCIGIDLNTEYVDLAVKRITDDAGMFAEIVT